MGLFKKATPKPPKVRLSDLAHTSQADIERIVNGAPVPAGAPRWKVDTRPQRRRKS